MDIKARFDLRKASLFDKIFVSVIVLGLIIGSCYYIPPLFEEETNEETLEVYSFEIETEVILLDCPVIRQANKILSVFVGVEEGSVMINSQLQLNDTEIASIWVITVSGVIANTSQGLIRDQGLERVAFLPPRTLVVVAVTWPWL